MLAHDTRLRLDDGVIVGTRARIEAVGGFGVLILAVTVLVEVVLLAEGEFPLRLFAARQRSISLSP